MTGTSFLPAMAGVIIALKIKKLINQFTDTDTTSPRNAKTLEMLNVRPDNFFRRLMRRGVLMEAAPGKYYLDEAILEKYNKRRRMIMITVLLLLAALIILDTIYLHY